jgi:hypothetical protein
MLQNLSLTNYIFSEKGLKALTKSHWPLLQTLKLQQCSFKGTYNPESKTPWPYLHSLSLVHCQLEHPHSTFLSAHTFPLLQFLNLKGT